jgi:hypothetical protein
MSMTEVSIKRPVFVTMVTLGALVLGLLAMDKLYGTRRLRPRHSRAGGERQPRTQDS